MSATLEIRVGGALDHRPGAFDHITRWVGMLRDRRDRRAVRSELARMPAYLLDDIGIDPRRIDVTLDERIARRRA